MEQYGRARQTTDTNIIRLMCIACWITKATDTHSEHVKLFVLHGNNGYRNALRCDVYTYPVGLACVFPLKELTVRKVLKVF